MEGTIINCHHSAQRVNFIPTVSTTMVTNQRCGCCTLFPVCRMLNDWSNIDLARQFYSLYHVGYVGILRLSFRSNQIHLSTYRPMKVQAAVKHRILKHIPNPRVQLSPLPLAAHHNLPPNALTPLLSHALNGSRLNDG
jgi:hypothetical protein